MAQSPEKNPSTTEVIRYDLGWKAINAMLRAGRSLSGHERNCCFLNTGGERFANVSAAAGLDLVDDGRVLSLADWDYDGDIDFWIANRSGPQIRYLRNEGAPDHHFVALSLQGVNANRDAIGARVTVVVDDGASGRPTRQTKTLRAGDGYLSQSSKWLHFGVGTADRIAKVIVRWPGGAQQEFEHLDADSWYLATQGQRTLGRWTPPIQQFQALESARFDAPAVSDRARIVLLEPLPIPSLSYVDTAGKERSLTTPSSQPRLIHVWATWCAPCLEELKRWNDRAAALESADLQVIAVNIDEGDIGAARKASVDSVRTSLDLRFQVGLGSGALATSLDVLQRSLLSRERPLPVPCSFLVDSDGRLRAIYKGPVEVDTLLQDRRLLDSNHAAVLAAATPFSGRWSHPPGGSTPLQLALKLVEGGYPDQAQRYIESLIERHGMNSHYVSASLLNLHGAVHLDQQRYQQAAKAFAKAVELDAGNRQAHIELGELLLRAGRGEQAAQHFQKALIGNRDDPELLYKLGLAQVQQHQFRAAEESLRRSSQLRTSSVVHWQLGNVYVALKNADRAVSEYERALQLNSQLIASANNLAWLLATSDDDKLRNGRRAVELARAICTSDEGRSAGNLDTLAAALAEVRQFDDAIRTAQDAMESAKLQGHEELAERIRRRLELYQKGQAFRERLSK